MKEHAINSSDLYIYLAIRCLIANYWTKWPVTLKGSHRRSILWRPIKWAKFRPEPSRWTVPLSLERQWCTGFIRGILRGVRYAKSLRVLFLHRRSPSWTTLVLYSRVVFIFNEPTNGDENSSRYSCSPFRQKPDLLLITLIFHSGIFYFYIWTFVCYD